MLICNDPERWNDIARELGPDAPALTDEELFEKVTNLRACIAQEHVPTAYHQVVRCLRAAVEEKP
jgi:glutathione synthase/RimK-type ligase-like ATP-grasp enzyme